MSNVPGKRPNYRPFESRTTEERERSQVSSVWALESIESWCVFLTFFGCSTINLPYSVKVQIAPDNVKHTRSKDKNGVRT